MVRTERPAKSFESEQGFCQENDSRQNTDDVIGRRRLLAPTLFSTSFAGKSTTCGSFSEVYTTLLNSVQSPLPISPFASFRFSPLLFPSRLASSRPVPSRLVSADLVFSFPSASLPSTASGSLYSAGVARGRGERYNVQRTCPILPSYQSTLPVYTGYADVAWSGPPRQTLQPRTSFSSSALLLLLPSSFSLFLASTYLVFSACFLFFFPRGYVIVAVKLSFGLSILSRSAVASALTQDHRTSLVLSFSVILYADLFQSFKRSRRSRLSLSSRRTFLLTAHSNTWFGS